MPCNEEIENISKHTIDAIAAISVRVEELLIERQKSRETKNWERADLIRDELNSMNVIIEDSPEGPKWKIE